MEDKDKLSYALGLDVGQSFKRLPTEINLDVLTKALKDVFTDQKLELSQEEFQSEMQAFQKTMQAEGEKVQGQMSEKNIKEGLSFLEENKKRDGVVVTESGLQYEVISEGEGPQAIAEDTVSVHYAGTLINGTEFDSSIKRGQPAQFPVKGVIPGWTEALQIMNVGSKYKLYIPADLAYGERGAGQDIGPHSTLVFEVELLDIVK